MGKIVYNELDTPEAFVSRHIAKFIGLNVRHGAATYNADSKEWVIPLRAIVPSRVRFDDSGSKTFLYRFNDLGTAIITKVNDKYEVVSFPASLQIDEELRMRFGNITEKIEKTLLEIGNYRWGKLGFIYQFLRPLFNIIYGLTRDGRVARADIELPKQEPYLNLLTRMGLAEINSANENAWLKPTELFTGFSQDFAENNHTLDPHTIARGLLGMVFAKEYHTIREDTHIRVPTVYVDAAKAYYINAVRIGHPIIMTPSQLLYHYKLFEHSKQQQFKFNSIVGELVSVKLLDSDEQDNIVANKEVFEKVLPLQNELITVAAEAK
jgi:hypothetical protein